MTDVAVEDDAEAAALKWRTFLEENIDDLLEGWPKRPPGWWERGPDECPVEYMLRIFPLAKPN